MDSGNKLNSELLWYRVMLCIGVVAMPLYGLMVQDSDPTCQVFMSHRYFQSGLWLALFLSSFLFNWVKLHLVTATCWLVLGLNLWAVCVTFINDFSIDYTIGLFIAFCVLNMTIRRPRLYFIFTSVTVIFTVTAAWLSPQPLIEPSFISFASVILGAALMMTSTATIHYERKLFELNLTLEKKVDERTAVAEERARQLVIKNNDLEQFAYVASHDLKSPLRNISGFIQLIQRKIKNSPEPELHEYLSYVVVAVKKMNAIIEDVLLFSRYGDKTLNFQENCVKSLIREASSLIYRETENRQELIRIDNAVDKVPCDRSQLEQLFRNLMENALKYNTSPAPEIDISVRESDTEFIFSIRDNGIGIPEEFHHKIFTMFQRLHSDGEYSGTGIGLALCKRIVENHQGKIWVKSIIGEGTTFFFTISKHLQVSKQSQILREAMAMA